MHSRSQSSLLDHVPGARSASAQRDTNRPGWLSWLLPLFALACWTLAIRHLSPEWTLNEQYHFGWLVPALAAYLIKVRFERLPAEAPAPSRWLVSTAVLFLAFASVLIMPIREANLDWRLVEWSLAGVAIAASLVCFWQLGGFPWVRQFTFPLFFFLIAVPLPRNLEYPWMDRLMLNNASISVELLHWLGVDAQARGNLIQLPTCTLGVEEACSGIRSLQSTLMLSLFLGEILALRWPRRLVLLAAALGWALVTNVGRTATLGWLAARDGLPAVDRWHDTAGFSVLALCAITVTFTAWLLHRSSLGNAHRSPDAQAFDAATFASRLRPAATAGGFSIILLFVGLGLNKFWFDLHERALTAVTEWEFRLPTEQPFYRDLPISPLTQRILHASEGYSGGWQDTSGTRWQAFYFRWYAGRSATQTARKHDPRDCLGRMGMELLGELPRVEFSKGDLTLLFRAYHFRDGQHDLYLFNCLTEDLRALDQTYRGRESNSPSARFAAAVAGRRQAGQRRVEVAVWGAPDAATAARRFSALLAQQIQVGGQSLNP